MKKILVICIAILFIFNLTGCREQTPNNQNSTNNDNPENISNGSIKDISIGSSAIYALNEKNELYVIGKGGMTGLGLGEDIEFVSTPTKVTDNVKSFLNEGSVVYYITSNNDLYYSGLRLEGGVEHSFTKIKENVKQVASYAGFCLFILDFNNNSYGASGRFSEDACALSYDKYSELTPIASNVKQVFANYTRNGYINNNNELYVISGDESEYTKLIANVKKVVNIGFEYYVLTEDNILYISDDYNDENPIKKIAENVIDVADNGLYFKSSDGYLYFTDYSNDLLVASDVEDYFRLKFDNVEKILYKYNRKYIYLNTDNKIEMYTEYDHYVLDNDISSMVKMLEFVSD